MAAKIKSLSGKYARSFDRRPLLTLTITNALLNGLGDAAAQTLPLAMGTVDFVEFAWSHSRSIRFLTFGACMGPFLAKWNHFIEHQFPLVPPPQQRVPTSHSIPLRATRSADATKPPASPALRQRQPSVNPQFDHQQQEAPRLTEKTATGQDHVVIDAFGPPAFSLDQHESKQLDRMPYPDELLQEKARARAHPNQSLQHQQQQAAAQVSYLQLLKRLAADQLGMAPLGLAVFLTYMGILSGSSQADIMQMFQNVYPTLLLANWQIWPLVQCINFRFIPLAYRVPFSASCGILWTVFLSFQTAKGGAA